RCEPVRWPTVRTVPVKTPEQQAQLMPHRVRDLLVRQRTQVVNALRSDLAELGIVAAQGYDGVKALLSIIADTGDTRLPENARASLSALVAQICCCQAGSAEPMSPAATPTNNVATISTKLGYVSKMTIHHPTRMTLQRRRGK